VGRFAFITHPDRAEDIRSFLAPAQYLPLGLAEGLGGLLPPRRLPKMRLEFPCGSAEGFIITINKTSRQVEALSQRDLTKLIIKAGRMAEGMDAQIIGLGGCTGRAGSAVAQAVNITVAGESVYHIATAMDSLEEALSMMGYGNKNVHAAVLGAAGPAGRTASQILSGRVKSLVLVDSHKEKINELAGNILFNSGLSAGLSTDPQKAVKDARLVVVARDTGIVPEDLSPGTVLCDLIRPSLLGRRTAAARDDILVIEGAVIKLPGAAGNYAEPGYPPGLTGPCLAETIMLALEMSAKKSLPTGRTGPEEVEGLRRLARKHGFSRVGLKGPGGLIDAVQVANVKKKAFIKITGAAG
jgi:predicted amino acid dehydrogenase